MRAAPGSGSAPMSGLGYRPELDGLRGIAILVVLSVHYTNYPRGGLQGVDMFFTLSGFLITTLLLEEWQADGSVSLRNFYLRRYFRLFPGLAALIACYVLYVLILGRANVGLRLGGAAYAITYTSNWAQAFNLPYPFWEIGHLWSLAVEEQFYLVWPVILILLLRRRLGLRGIMWVLGGMIGAVAIWRFLLYVGGADGNRLYFGTDTRFDQLLVGCLVGVVFVRRGARTRPSRWAGILAVPSAGYILLSLVVGTRWSLAWGGGLTVFAVAIAITIYACVTGSSPFLTRLLSLRWLVFVGVISYSLYLWHVSGSLALQRFGHLHGWELIVSEVALSFALACASYYLVELPFLKRRKAYQRLGATKADLDAGGEPGQSAQPSREPGRARPQRPLSPG
jgi:peptidoglycan/LPS O-acetylase OafA/YrhL